MLPTPFHKIIYAAWRDDLVERFSQFAPECQTGDPCVPVIKFSRTGDTHTHDANNVVALIFCAQQLQVCTVRNTVISPESWSVMTFYFDYADPRLTDKIHQIINSLVNIPTNTEDNQIDQTNPNND